MSELAKRVQEAIDSSSVDVEEIAKQCGITKQAVYKWTRGETKKISGENLIVLAHLTGYEPMWLIKGTGHKKRLNLNKDDLHAVKINRALGVKERNAWYRVGDSLAEQPEENPGESEEGAK